MFRWRPLFTKFIIKLAWQWDISLFNGKPEKCFVLFDSSNTAAFIGIFSALMHASNLFYVNWVRSTGLGKKITWWLASSFFPQYLFLTGYECHARREGCNNWCRCETCCVLLPRFVRSCELCPQCRSSGGSLVRPGLCSSEQGCSLVLPRWVVMAGFPIGLICGASLFCLALCSVTRAVTHVMMSYREVRYLVW